MQQQSLFAREDTQPLAARLRPRTLAEYVGQQHLLGPGKVLRQLIERDQISSMIFWGPPGVGKTTLARIIAHTTKSEFIDFFRRHQRDQRDPLGDAKRPSATGSSGNGPSSSWTRSTGSTRPSRTPFLPFVEKGSIPFLIGATTENPSFEINGALLSRCKVFVLQALTQEDLVTSSSGPSPTPRGFWGPEGGNGTAMLEAIATFANRGCPDGPVHPGDGGPQRHPGGRHHHGLLGDSGPMHRKEVPSLRQDRGGALQPHLRPPQVHAQLRPRSLRSTGWPGCWRRGGSPLHRSAGDPVCQRGRGLGRSQGSGGGGGGLPGLPLHRYAGVLCPPDPGRGLPLPGAQVQCPVPGL